MRMAWCSQSLIYHACCLYHIWPVNQRMIHEIRDPREGPVKTCNQLRPTKYHRQDVSLLHHSLPIVTKDHTSFRIFHKDTWRFLGQSHSLTLKSHSRCKCPKVYKYGCKSPKQGNCNIRSSIQPLLCLDHWSLYT